MAAIKLDIVSLASLSQEESGGPSQAPPAAQCGHFESRLIATLDFSDTDVHVFRNLTWLAEVRDRLSQILPDATAFTFCTDEGVPVDDSDSLATYFAALRMTPALQDLRCTVYIKLPTVATNLSFEDPYIIEFVRLKEADQAVVEAFLDQSVFQGQSLGNLTLGELRPLVKSMSIGEDKDVFCFRDGSRQSDQTRLHDYLFNTAMKPLASSSGKVTTYSIFFRDAKANASTDAKEVDWS